MTRTTPPHVVAVERDVPLAAPFAALPVLWWVPTDVPVVGIAWLQHGYARKPHYLASLGAALTAQGLLVAMPTVESFRRKQSINDGPFLDAIGSALAEVLGASGAAADVAARAGVTLDARASARLVLVAHSAGCAVVARAARQALADGTPLNGIVLLDATENLAKTFAGSLDALADCEVRGVFAQPSWCNRKGQGARALAAARNGYFGIRLTTGTHCDAEGDDTDRVCRTMCGRPDPANVTVLFDATSAWVRDLALGRPTPAWSPGGDRLEQEVSAGRVEPLYAVAGGGTGG